MSSSANDEGNLSQRSSSDNNTSTSNNASLSQQQQQQSLAKNTDSASTAGAEANIPRVHSVSISLAGNYSISISRKGNTRLSFDKNSLSGMMIFDGGSRSEARLPLSIRKFKISKNLKRISYRASIQSERLGGKVSGRLRFQNPIEVATSDDQTLLPTPKSALKIIVRDPVVTAKKGSRGKIEFNQTGQALVS